jgi:hypothetical protein
VLSTAESQRALRLFPLALVSALLLSTAVFAQGGGAAVRAAALAVRAVQAAMPVIGF